MVPSLCGFGHMSPKRILPSTDQELKSDQEKRPDTLTESIIRCINPRCSWSITKKKKIQPNLLHHQQSTKQHQQQGVQKQQHQQLQKQHQPLKNDCSLTTLEEWILASPGPNDFQLSRQSSYKKVYPSTTDMHHQHGTKSSLSSRKLTVDGVYKEADYSSTSFTSQSGKKIRKKVSFRLPEIADIFILDDPLTDA